MKMTDKKARILSNILSLALGIAIGFSGYAIANNAIDNNIPVETIEATTQEENAVISSTENHGITISAARLAAQDYALYAVDSQAESAYTLTASIYPSTADPTLDWTVNFKNPSSTWASGKDVSDYLTLSSTSNSLNAVITCKAAFAEQIEVKASARNNPDAYAICLVDYAKRLSDVSLTGRICEISEDSEYSGMYGIAHDEMDNWNDCSVLPVYAVDNSVNWSNFNERANVNYYYTDSVGTLAGTVVSTKLELKASDAFLNVYSTGAYYANAGECQYADWTEINVFGYAAIISELGKSFPAFDPEYGSPNAAGYSAFLDALKTYTSADFYVRVTVKMQYGEKLVDEIREFPCIFDRWGSVFSIIEQVSLPENVIY